MSMTKSTALPKTITMTAVVKDKPERGFSVVTKTISTDLGPEEVLIKVLSASFCGTDYHIYSYDDWSKNRLHLPLTVGHEFAGTIVKIGKDVKRVKIGDLVSAETHIICGKCEYCLSGNGHICPNTLIIGVDTDGCFADYVKIPAANCFINTPGGNVKYLSVQEPLGNAVHTVAHFPVKDKVVAIVGCGPIGLLGIDVAKAYGAKQVIAIEVSPYRRDLAMKLGADLIVDPTTQDTYQTIMSYTANKGVDVVCEFSGNGKAIQDAFRYVKKGGKMSMLGIPSRPVEIDIADGIVFKGIEIYGVVGRRIYETWEQVKELIDNNKLHLETVVTHEFPMREINRAAELMGEKNCGKIVMIPEGVK